MTEDEEFGIRHTHSNLFRFAAVIDHGEYRDSLALRTSSSFRTVSSTEWTLRWVTIPELGFDFMIRSFSL